MNLISLHLNNFFSYSNQTIEFNEEGIYIIYGNNKQTGSSNGIGKSVIKEAIKFSLYGKCRADSLDDAVKFGEEEMNVTINLKINNKDIEITRSRIKGKSSSLKLSVNGVDKTQSTKKLTDEFIVSLIGIDYEKFMHSFCFGQSPYDDLKELTSTKLIEFLKSVLNLDRFDKYLLKTKELKAKNNDIINKLLGVKETYSKLLDTEVNKKDLNTKLKKYTTLIKDTELVLKPFVEKYDKFIIQRDKYKKDYNIKSSNLNTESLKLQHIRVNATCPTCKQPLQDKKLKDKLSRLCKQLEKEKSDITNELTILNTQITSVEEKVNELEFNISDSEDKVIELKTKLEMKSKSDMNIDDVEIKYKQALSRGAKLDKLIDVFSSKGLPLFILNNYIPKLELVVNEILAKVCDFKINLKTMKKLKSSSELRSTCEIELFKGSRIYPLSNLSNGEEFIITLAFRIGISRLYQVDNKFETLILDECFASLGRKNRRKVLLLINSLDKYFKKILVISHIDEVRDWRKPHHIDIIKDGDTSKIIYNINREE